jgi:hypothetical protein
MRMERCMWTLIRMMKGTRRIDLLELLETCFIRWLSCFTCYLYLH